MPIDENLLHNLHIYDTSSNPHQVRWNQTGAAPLDHAHEAKDLPIATKSALGIVSIGNNINISPEGVISLNVSDSLSLNSSTTLATSKAIKNTNDKFPVLENSLISKINDLNVYVDGHVTRIDSRITDLINKHNTLKTYTETNVARLDNRIDDLKTYSETNVARLDSKIDEAANEAEENLNLFSTALSNKKIKLINGAIVADTSFGANGNVLSLNVTALNPDYLNKVVPYAKGGTGRTDGTVWKADEAVKSKFASKADLAEFYKSDVKLEPGELVGISEFDGFDITKFKGSGLPLGIVSSDPGFVLNHDEHDIQNSYPIARIGVVPALVKGPCKKGDFLCPDKEGTLIKTDDPFKKFCFSNENKSSYNVSLIEIII